MSIQKLKKIIVISLFLIMVIAAVVITSIIFDADDSLRNICTIQFEANGGSEVLSQSITCGEFAQEPDLPKKIGFTFVNWFYDDKVFDFENFKVNQNLILTAKWEQEPETEIIIVHFNTRGGSPIDNIEIAKGQQLTPPISPTKSGYNFDGWYYNDSRFDFMTTIEEEITLVANWTKIANTNSSKPDFNIGQNTESNEKSTNSGKCVYQMKSRAPEYASIPWGFYIGKDTQLASYWGFWSYTSDTCRITYKTDDSNILSISSTGVATGKEFGKTNLYICVVDKLTNKELDCFQIYANVKYEVGSTSAENASEKLVNEIKGYYWYLDGYTDAYLYPTINNGYLTWKSKYMNLVNKTFVTTEATGMIYYDPVEINSNFGKIVDRVYMLIEDYNMHVSNDKLYITIGGKTYSFTKKTFSRDVTGVMNLSVTDTKIKSGEWVTITVNTKPFYANYSLEVSSSNDRILACNSIVNESMGNDVVSCIAWSSGNATVTIRDRVTNVSKQVDVIINKVAVNGISLNKTSLSLTKGDSEKLTATIMPNNADNKNVIWTSSNDNVVTVNKGIIKALGKGTATITVKTVDGQYTATCTVEVTNPSLTAAASIGYSTSISNKGTISGISVTINATGGTGIYSYYYIKLYTSDGTMIGKTSDTSSNKIIISGYKNGGYYAEFVVRDSNGTEYRGKTDISNISM